jgi:FkbM family methyltransferase
MTIKQAARRLLEFVVDRYGYALKDKASPPLGLPGFGEALKANGFRPETVIDVGVGYGTEWLYNAFPSSHFELFEPLDVFVPAMEKICNRLKARYHVTALGSRTGLSEIEMNVDIPTSSTMSGFSAVHSPIKKAGRLVTIEQKSIPVHRLDEFGPFKAPVLLKIDVEGFEMDVLQGASATLEQTEVLIAEVSVTKRHENDVSFGTFITYVESLGFSLIDIPELTPLRRKGALSYVDAAFARSGSQWCR